MTTRDNQIRQVLAELDGHIAEVEASVTVLKALLADDEAPEDAGPLDDLKTQPTGTARNRTSARRGQ